MLFALPVPQGSARCNEGRDRFFAVQRNQASIPTRLDTCVFQQAFAGRAEAASGEFRRAARFASRRRLPTAISA